MSSACPYSSVSVSSRLSVIVPCPGRSHDSLVAVEQAALLSLSLLQSKPTGDAPPLTVPFLEVTPSRNHAFLANRELLHSKWEADGLDVFVEDKRSCQLKYSHIKVQNNGVEEGMLDHSYYVDFHGIPIRSIE